MSVRVGALAATLALATLAMPACATQKLKLEMSREIKLIPPTIRSLGVDPAGQVDTSEKPRTIKVTMMGDPELQATFDLEGRLKAREMQETEPGVYTGSFEVQTGETGVVDVVGHLVHTPTGAKQDRLLHRAVDLVVVPPVDVPPSEGCAAGDAQDFENQLRALTVEFEFDEYDLTPRAREGLVAHQAVLASRPGCTIHVHGHADEIGSPAYNMDLSRKRAEEVARLIESELGVPPGRLEIHPHGETQPVDTSGTEAGMARNRRVELSALRTD
jgi:outer membrane protein OmpA-like peptidoglycan-associated protein